MKKINKKNVKNKYNYIINDLKKIKLILNS